MQSPLESHALVLHLGTFTSSGFDLIAIPLSLIHFEPWNVCTMLADMFKWTAAVGSITKAIFNALLKYVCTCIKKKWKKIYHLVTCWKIFNYGGYWFRVLPFQWNPSVQNSCGHFQELSPVLFDNKTLVKTLTTPGVTTSVNRYNLANSRLITLRIAVLKWLPKVSEPLAISSSVYITQGQLSPRKDFQEVIADNIHPRCHHRAKYLEGNNTMQMLWRWWLVDGRVSKWFKFVSMWSLLGIGCFLRHTTYAQGIPPAQGFIFLPSQCSGLHM